MSKNYDVAVRWHISSAAPETTTVHVEAATTAQALKLARRGIYLDHPGAAIDKTEIVYLDTPEKAAEVISLVTPEAAAIEAAAIEDGAVESGFAQPEPAAVEVPVAVFGRASTLVAQIANRYGTTAVGAFLDAMDEFMGSRRADGWNGSRLFIKIAKVPELKRKAA